MVGGYFWFRALTDSPHTFMRDIPAKKEFELTFIEDKSTETRTFALQGHRIAPEPQTIYACMPMQSIVKFLSLISN